MDFDEKLTKGKLTESRVFHWLRGRGNTLVPVYDVPRDQRKGPQIYLPHYGIVAPDLLGLKDGSPYWVEVKTKRYFSWYREHQCWTTGVDIYLYEDYQEVMKRFGWDLWLFFLHESSEPDPNDLGLGSPPTCPAGLFGQSLAKLVHFEDHRGAGVVWWAHQDLRLLATLEALREITGNGI